MERLNVCLLNDSFPPAIDGVANTIFNYASIIQEQLGTAIVTTPKYPHVQDVYPFKVLRYPSFDTTRIIGYRAGNPFHVNFLSKFNDLDIDILHSHCPAVSTVLGRMIRKSIKKPLVLTYHTKFDIDLKHSLKNEFIIDTALKGIVINCESADEVWAVSRGAGESLRNIGYKGDYIVMPNGVDFEKGRASDEDIASIRQRFKLSDKLTFLFVGRMMWYKGLKIIIDALKQVKRHGIDFQMIFIGAGADKSEVEQYVRDSNIADNCIFTGAILNRTVLKAMYSCADLFLFPSTYDTNGIVVREAAATGLGSVLVEGSCAAEDTTDGVNALWIKENSDSLAKLLIRNGNNRDYYHQIGNNAQQQLYTSWQEAVYHAFERYHEIIDKFDYQQSHGKSSNITDSYFNLWGNLSLSLTKTKDKIRNLNDLYSYYIRHNNRKIGTKVDDFTQEEREELSEYISNSEDRYL